jgi:DNA processing protein
MTHTQKSELQQWLAFYLCKGLGIVTLQKINKILPLNQVCDKSYQDLINLGITENIARNLSHTDWHYIDELITHINLLNIKVRCYFSDGYPPLLKQIHSAPLLLFCQGDLDLLHHSQISIVGSRSASPSGLQAASELAYQLSLNNFVITSGLALGIDAAAHKGALANNGHTIAVLGTGIDVIYPKRHFNLAHQIIERGLLISEFLPGTQPHARNFPRRNRIISGLSLGTLVVEAEIKSGSLITAKYALEHNREVFAMPGSIYNPLSQGCHLLIKQGAKLIENVDDIIEELSFLSKSCLYIKREHEKKEEDPVLAQLGFEVTAVDVIAQRLNLPVEQILPRLLDLELEEKIERVIDGYIKLKG